MRTPHPGEIESLLSALRGAGWREASSLCGALGLVNTESNRRWIRVLAGAADGHVASGPGSPGYHLTEELPPNDWHYIEGLRTQRDEMDARYIRIARVWHGHRAKAESRKQKAENQPELALA